MFSRRQLSLQALGALAPGLCHLASRADAQGFPSGTVRIIVPFPPGGATDVLGRVVAHELQTMWGQSVVAEYKPGASGLLGSRQVATAPADGYTLLLASTGAILSLASSQNADANYRIERELAPVSLVAAPPYIVVVNPSVPVKTLDRLDVTREGEELSIDASARSFLHSQVRSMVGALALVGEGRWSADDLSAALAARDRTACAPVAPPEGLYLVQVDY